MNYEHLQIVSLTQASNHEFQTWISNKIKKIFNWKNIMKRGKENQIGKVFVTCMEDIGLISTTSK